jgi:hypothetical protein
MLGLVRGVGGRTQTGTRIAATTDQAPSSTRPSCSAKSARSFRLRVRRGRLLSMQQAAIQASLSGRGHPRRCAAVVIAAQTWASARPAGMIVASASQRSSPPRRELPHRRPSAHFQSSPAVAKAMLMSFVASCRSAPAGRRPAR